MGWDSCNEWTKKSDVINHVLNGFIRNGWKYHAKKSTSEGLWVVAENTSGCKFIYFALIVKHGRNFSLKTMSEHMGPSYLSCPIEFFAIADAPSPSEKFAIEWRYKVIHYHAELVANKARQKRELFPGQQIKLYNKIYNFLEFRENKVIVIDKYGKNYRLTRKQLGQWEEVTPLEKALIE